MNHYKKYESAVKDMNIPDVRKEANSPNALWFLRTGVALNKDKPKILNAIFHARQIV